MSQKGRYGIHGGQYIPETLMNEIKKLEDAYEFYKKDEEFNQELNTLLKEYAALLCGEDDEGSGRSQDLL